MSERKENKLTQWLDQLQEQSWNLELIISGFALVGLFQLRDFLVLRTYYLSANGSGLSDAFSLSLNILKISLDIFIFSLLVLVFTRGLWIGAIGLRYVSGNIDFDAFKYNDRLKQFLKRKVGSFDDYIHRLEHISSSVFAFTYLLFFISVTLVLSDMELRLLYNLIEPLGGDGVADMAVSLLLLIFVIVFFDFLSLGLLKSIKQPIFASVYLVLYRLVGILTLSFLWRPIWYNFIDQRSTKWIGVLAIPFLFAFIIFNAVPFQNFVYNFFPKLERKLESGRFSSVYYKENARAAFQSEFYDNLRQAERAAGNYEIIEVMSIPTHRIEVPLMEVFVKYTEFIDDFITRQDSTLIAINEVGWNSLGEIRVVNTPIVRRTKSEYERQYDERKAIYEQQYDSLSKLDPVQAEELSLTFVGDEQLRYRNYLETVKTTIKQSLSFEINNQPIPDSTIFLDFHIHPNFGEKGFVCTFPLQHAHLGTNYLSLKRKFYAESAQTYHERDFTIPFIYMNTK